MDSFLVRDNYMIASIGIISWILICFVEMRQVRHRQMLFRNVPRDDPKMALAEHTQFHSVDHKYLVGVLRERAKVNHLLITSLAKMPVVCDGVYKRHHEQTVVDRTHLTVSSGEIFGILGSTGTGKSVMLELFAGGKRLTYGRIYISGKCMHDDLFEVYKEIGYCPQYDSLPESFTVQELFYIFYMFNGMAESEMNAVCLNMAKVFGFFPYYYVSFRLCSCGIRRRISCAIAFLGNPRVIFLDEPYSSVDPCGKRIMRNMFGKLKAENKTIIIATLNAQECEILCDRVAVMYKGANVYIGRPYQLSGKYNTGYNVTMYKRRSRMHGTEQFAEHAEEFIMREFKDAVVYSRRDTLMKVFIPSASASLAQIFEKMNANKLELDIMEFAVSRTPLYNFLIRVADVVSMDDE